MLLHMQPLPTVSHVVSKNCLARIIWKLIQACSLETVRLCCSLSSCFSQLSSIRYRTPATIEWVPHICMLCCHAEQQCIMPLQHAWIYFLGDGWRICKMCAVVFAFVLVVIVSNTGRSARDEFWYCHDANCWRGEACIESEIFTLVLNLRSSRFSWLLLVVIRSFLCSHNEASLPATKAMIRKQVWLLARVMEPLSSLFQMICAAKHCQSLGFEAWLVSTVCITVLVLTWLIRTH